MGFAPWFGDGEVAVATTSSSNLTGRTAKENKMTKVWILLFALLLPFLASCHAVSRNGKFFSPADCVRVDCRGYLDATHRVADLEAERTRVNQQARSKEIDQSEKTKRLEIIQGELRDARYAQSLYYQQIRKHRRAGMGPVVDEELGGRTECPPDD
jgi:hypothetical protein